MVVAVSHRATTNLGDLVCSPCLYFDYGAQHCDIKSLLPVADAYIFGGGAMFRSVARADVSGIKIGWGLGQTNHNLKTTIGCVPEDFALFGSRDVGQAGAEWVPCASCMSPLFDDEYEITQGVVAYFNRNVKHPQSYKIPVLHNGESFEEAIRFIGSASVCVTNSYHGAYWATLLGRAAVIVRPHSSKFYCYKHQPGVVESGSWRNADTTVFHDALDECRDANIAFDAKVRDLIC